MLDKAKLALRIATDAFNDEINGLIQAALADLALAGVSVHDEPGNDPLIVRAVLTYCKLHFGEPEKVEMYDRLKASYDEQKAQLSMASGYTDWGR